MFELSLTEIALVLIVGVIVIGPKDLPVVIRTARKWLGEAKTLTGQLYSELHEAVDATAIKHTGEAVFKEAKYILDQNGNHQQVYDISDFLSEKQPPKVIDQPIAEPDHEPRIG